MIDAPHDADFILDVLWLDDGLAESNRGGQCLMRQNFHRHFLIEVRFHCSHNHLKRLFSLEECKSNATF